LDKKKWKQLVPELTEKGIDNDVIEKLKINIKSYAPESEYLNQVIRYLGGLSKDKMGLLDLIRIDPTLARGLNYYTGIIFEVVLVGKKYRKNGSIAAGGRYDNLCDSPCVGFSLGIDRMLTIIKTPKSYDTVTAWIIQIDKDMDDDTISQLYAYRLDVLSKLRNRGVYCDTEPRAEAGFGPQMKYVLKNDIPFIVFVGKTEMETNTITLKDMNSRTQKNMRITEAYDWLV